MGYYTNYKLEGATKEQIAHLKSLSYDADYALTNEGNTEQEAKWYDYEKDMLVLSKLYPNTVFMLHGSGQEGEHDVWVAYFQNGKMQFEREDTTLVMPFDASKLA